MRRVAATHLIFLGDLNRFKAKFMGLAAAQAAQQRSGAADARQLEEACEKAKAQAQQFYNRAKTVFPHEGKAYHLLG